MLKPRTPAALGVMVCATALACAAPAPLVAAAIARAAQSPPADGGSPVISGSASVGQALTASTGSWSGDQPFTFSYQWQRCDAAAAADCVPVAGATGSSYLVSSADLSSTLLVSVTAVNDAGSGVAVSASTPVVAAAPGAAVSTAASAPAAAAAAPVATSQPNPVGQAQEGGTLTVGPSSWNGAAPLSFGYQWQRCSGSAPVCASLAGATGEDYQLGAADVGTRLRVVVTASNGAGSAEIASNLSPPVLVTPSIASPPVELAAPALSGRAQVGQKLTASPGGWSGTATVRVSDVWERCGAGGAGCVPIPGATATTYLVAAAELGSTLRVVVTATSAGGSASAASAVTAAVSAPAAGFPALPGLALDPYHARAPGYDTSFPDCGHRAIPVGGFLIVGANDGRPFTSNPCFAREYASASAQAVPAAVYLNTAYSSKLLPAITPACSAGSAGTSTSVALRKAYALGCSEAATSLFGPLAGVPPAVIWLDVETSNAWSSRTSLNAATLAGMRAELQSLAPKTSVGVYSNASWWSRITGGVQSPTMPEWTPLRPLAGGTCPPGFAGGPVWLWQGGSASLDVDHPC